MSDQHSDDTQELDDQIVESNQIDLEKFNHNRYWELKSLETTIRHARSILDTINSNPMTLQTVSQIQDPIELRKKLEIIERRIYAALKTCPQPRIEESLPPYLSSPLICQIKTPELPTLPDLKEKSSKEEKVVSPSTELIKETVEKALPKEEIKQTKPKEPMEKKKKIIENQSLNLNMNTKQEELTEELSEMAMQLKKNVQHFNKLLIEDEIILSINQTKLELNSNLMSKEGERLNHVSLKNRSMTWFTIAAVLVVAFSWILMFIIIRLT